MSKPLILVLCTGNSCRSQIAEGLLQEAVGDAAEVASAGSKPAGYVHPVAVEVMAEVGIDLSSGVSKHLDEFLKREVAVVITVCGHADQECPRFPGQMKRYHWPFDDPAHATGSEDEIKDEFRRVRDEISRVFGAYGHGWTDGRETDPT